MPLHLACTWFYSDDQSRVSIVASEHFTNDDFCNLIPLTGSGVDHVYHDNVTATGYSHGYCTGEVDMTISPVLAKPGSTTS